MRSAAMLLIFVFALLMIVGVYLSKTLFILQRYAVVDAVEGTADLLVHGRGRPVPVEVGKLVRARDVLITAPGSSVDLRWVGWTGGMRIRVGEKTRFTLVRATVGRSDDSEDSRLRVDVGRIWVRFHRALTGRSKFEVETPTVVAAVRGTAFSVAVEPDGATEVQVFEGQVSLAGRGGTGTTLTTGSQALVRPRDPSAESVPLSAEALQAWQAQSGLIGPFLEVTSPLDGVLVAEPTVAVAGRVEPGSQVFVNAGEVSVSREGLFAEAVALEPGLNTVVVTARGPAGRETTAVLTVPRAGP